MPNPVVYFEIAGKDVKELNDFYSSVFGWETEVEPNSGTYSVVSPPEPGIPGHLFPVTEEMGFNNWVTFYIEVDDIQAYLDKAESLGGKTCILLKTFQEIWGLLQCCLIQVTITLEYTNHLKINKYLRTS